MNRMKPDMELLAPAGSMEALKSAAACGADAVYAGISKFGARAYAENFSTGSLCEALDFLHLQHKKLYLTVNTLMKEPEISEALYAEIAALYEYGLDGVIVQDFGVLSFLREQFPGLPLHASTQMGITGASSAAFLKDCGVSRIVAARELSLQEIRTIKQEADVELEVFIHGALCYCLSGSCLYSSMLGGRSGNRGRCAQPCRMSYTVDMPGVSSHARAYMSLKDLCGLEMLPKLAAAGVDSLKIEGRMRSPEYTAVTTFIYRKYIDLLADKGPGHFRVEEEDRRLLAEFFNRGGFTKGYFDMHNSGDMLSPYRVNHHGRRIGEAKKERDSLVMNLTEDLHPKDVIEVRDAFEQILCKETVLTHIPANHPFRRPLPRKYSASNMGVYRVHNEQLIIEWHERISRPFTKRAIRGTAVFRAGEPAQLTVTDAETSTTVCAAQPEVQSARQQPMGRQEFLKSLQKTGETPFVWEKLDIICGDSVFVPKQQLNALRREALHALEDALLKPFRRELKPSAPKAESDGGASSEGYNESARCFQNRQEAGMPAPTAPKNQKGCSVLVRTVEQLQTVCKWQGADRIYVEDTLFFGGDASAAVLKKPGVLWYLAMTPFFRMNVKDEYRKYFNEIQRTFDGVLARSPEGLCFLREMGYNGNIVADGSLYIWNSQAARFFETNLPGVTFTAPSELNAAELAENQVSYEEIPVYGHTMLMTTANCIFRTADALKKQNIQKSGSKAPQICNNGENVLYLTDRYQKRFPVIRDCRFCNNTIWNAVPLCLFKELKQLEALSIPRVRISFTVESAAECTNVLQAYEATRHQSGLHTVDAFYKRLPNGFTRGHFKRGVE